MKIIEGIILGCIVFICLVIIIGVIKYSDEQKDDLC